MTDPIKDFLNKIAHPPKGRPWWRAKESIPLTPTERKSGLKLSSCKWSWNSQCSWIRQISWDSSRSLTVDFPLFQPLQLKDTNRNWPRVRVIVRSENPEQRSWTQWLKEEMGSNRQRLGLRRAVWSEPTTAAATLRVPNCSNVSAAPQGKDLHECKCLTLCSLSAYEQLTNKPTVPRGQWLQHHRPWTTLNQRIRSLLSMKQVIHWEELTCQRES